MCVCEKRCVSGVARTSENCENGLLLGLHHAHIRGDPAIFNKDQDDLKCLRLFFPKTPKMCLWLISGFGAVG